MATPATSEISALLAPISEAEPAGVDLRQDSSPTSVYFQLKDARGAARRAERAADEGGEQRQITEWQTILTLAPKVLAEQSKDLEIAAWYIEALLRNNGFAGLRDGFTLAAGLLEQYWDTFHSLQDEEGLATRLAPLAGLNGVEMDGTLIQPMRKVALTVEGGDQGPFSFYDYEQAMTLSQIADAAVRARRIERGAVSMEAFTAAVNASGGRFYVSLIEDLEGALKEFAALCALLEAKAGMDGPPTSSIQDMLSNILTTLLGLTKDLVAVVTQANADAQAVAAGTEEAVAAGGGGGGGGAGIPSTAGVLRNREDALRMLLQLAEYFRTTEPQSPVSTMLEETVRRARMSFQDLLAELLPDVNQWRSVLTNAGIKPPDSV